MDGEANHGPCETDGVETANGSASSSSFVTGRVGVTKLEVRQNRMCTPIVAVHPERSIVLTSPGSLGEKSSPMSSVAHW